MNIWRNTIVAEMGNNDVFLEIHQRLSFSGYMLNNKMWLMAKKPKYR